MMDTDVTEADVLAALERATRESGLRARRPGEFDAYQWQAHLAAQPEPVIITAQAAEDRLQQLVKAGRLGTALAQDVARRHQMRVYWWIAPED